jgi:hypothetical protein
VDASLDYGDLSGNGHILKWPMVPRTGAEVSCIGNCGEQMVPALSARKLGEEE